MNTTVSTRLLAGFIAVSAIATAQAAYADALTAQFGFSIVETDDNGDELLIERDTVRPGETIEYALEHKNVSDDPLSGLVLNGPIPDGVTLAAGSQTSSIAAVFEVQAELEPEIEGLEWSTWPAERKVIDADGTARIEPLPAEAVEAVRWTLDEALPSGETAQNSYRVIVN